MKTSILKKLLRKSKNLNEDELTHTKYKHYRLFGHRTDVGMVQERLA